MKIRIKETKEVTELTLRDKNGIDYFGDLSANDDNITYNREDDVYECDSDTYDFWETVIG